MIDIEIDTNTVERAIRPLALNRKNALFAGSDEAGMRHIAIATGGGRPNKPLLKWVNTGLGNVKNAILGTCRSCDPQHAERYLAAYEWRFNRRFDFENDAANVVETNIEWLAANTRHVLDAEAIANKYNATTSNYVLTIHDTDTTLRTSRERLLNDPTIHRHDDAFYFNSLAQVVADITSG